MVDNSKYLDAVNEQRYIRNIIDGELNRIAITDDENERLNMCYFLMIHIPKYVDASKKAHEKMKELNKLLHIEQTKGGLK